MYIKFQKRLQTAVSCTTFSSSLVFFNPGVSAASRPPIWRLKTCHCQPANSGVPGKPGESLVLQIAVCPACWSVSSQSSHQPASPPRSPSLFCLPKIVADFLSPATLKKYSDTHKKVKMSSFLSFRSFYITQLKGFSFMPR